MNFLQIILLGLVQGAAELLPISSSAHVIVVEKLLGLDPSSPEMTFLLVMLHTGTMFAVIAYFWRSWRVHYFGSTAQFVRIAQQAFVATVATVLVGLGLQFLIEKIVLHSQPHAEVELLFAQLPLIASALLAVGLLIFYAGAREEKQPGTGNLNNTQALLIGMVQGVCLPFRGFSRSGATISSGLLLGLERRRIEEFSFALAVVLTPLILAREGWRLLKAHHAETGGYWGLFTPGLLGMLCSFVSGLLALWLLSALLESGRWKYFGVYCLVAAGVVFFLAYRGF